MDQSESLTQNFGNPMLSIPPACLLEIAAEIDELKVIAKRWGIPERELKTLIESPSVKHQIESKRVELKNSGASFRMKAEVLAEEIMLEVYREAKSEDATRTFKLEVAKWLTKIADREPKPSATLNPGMGFSLQINIPNTAPTTINAPMERPVQKPEVIDVMPEPEEVADIEPPPPPRRKFDFNIEDYIKGEMTGPEAVKLLRKLGKLPPSNPLAGVALPDWLKDKAKSLADDLGDEHGER